MIARAVDVLDASGAVINTSQVTGKAGLNEASWNLQYPPPDRGVLRSIPPDDPHIWEQGRWEGRERPVDYWGLGAMNYRPRAVPGKYTVRLMLNGKPYSVAAGGVFEDRLKDVQAGRSAFMGLMQEIEAFNRTYSGPLSPIRSER